MAVITGANMFIEALDRENVEVIFGYPGGAVLPIYDRIKEANFKYVMPHHEQGGVHAADGYARSTGKVGVCFATSGPGATNMVTGLATAYLDSIPLVAFTGQVPRSMIGTDAFQEAGITGITIPITKHNYLVQDIEELPRIIKEAFHIARTGRPGPVLIDLPKDVMEEKAEFNYPDKVDLPGYKPNYEGHDLQVKEVAEAINQAQKPVIYAGGGVISSNASHKLRELANKASIPVTTTLNGIGAVDEREDLSLGMLGLHGTAEANLAISNADLLIAIGARFDNRATGEIGKFAEEAKIIHIDIDPAEIGKQLVVDIPIVGDIDNVLTKLNPLVDKNEHPDWEEEIMEWKQIEDHKEQEVEQSDKLLPYQIIEEIYNLTNGEAILTTEVGQHQMWAAHFYKFSNPRSFISSGGLGAMGYGFPAAIGAQFGNLDSIVFALAGDGSFQMNMQELATIAKNNLPVNIIIFNNQSLGMIRQLQEVYYGKRYFFSCLRQREICPPESQCSFQDFFECSHNNQLEMIPDFVKLAEAFGVQGCRITKAEEIKPALEEAINTPKPYLLDFVIKEEENVYPMVLDGDGLDEMILGREDIE